MPDDLMDWAYDLTKTNMQPIYDEADYEGGWKDKEKRAEMTEDEARYLVVHDSDEAATPLALVHFRFLLDGKLPQ